MFNINKSVLITLFTMRRACRGDTASSAVVILVLVVHIYVISCMMFGEECLGEEGLFCSLSIARHAPDRSIPYHHMHCTHLLLLLGEINCS